MSKIEVYKNWQKMYVYKFGGASVRNAKSIEKLGQIVSSAPKPLVIVVSAMGKTTDALERIVYAYHFHNQDFSLQLQAIKEYHLSVAKELFPANSNIFYQLASIWSQLDKTLRRPPSMNYDFDYDRIVPFGELLSTTIVANYLNQIGIKTKWIDARQIIKTDSNYREANINWQLTCKQIKNILNFSDTDIYLTQGFIGSDHNNLNVTLGREGSDFTGAIIAHCLNAKSLTVWKDVQGIYNADPKKFNFAKPFKKLSYRETIELAYYGAKVIHPKTIKPLMEKNIPLFVKSFNNPDAPGTVIENYPSDLDPLMPIIITKSNQTLITLANKDNSFITEKGFQKIFQILTQHNIKLNMLQNSALKLNIVIDHNPFKFNTLLETLKQHFTLKYNTNLTLYTIRHYNQNIINQIIQNKPVYLQQQTRLTAMFLVKD